VWDLEKINMFHDASEGGSINGHARETHTYIHGRGGKVSVSVSKARGMEKKIQGCSTPGPWKLEWKLVDPDLRLRFGPFDSFQLRAGNPAHPLVSFGIPSPAGQFVVGGEAQTRKTPSQSRFGLTSVILLRSSVGRHTGGITMTFLTCYE
jgi:hypothetical protein